MKKLIKWIFTFVITFAGAYLFVCSEGVSSNKVIATIDNDVVVGQFEQGLLGSNLQWTDNGDGLFTTDGVVKADALAAIALLPKAELRFPGGLLSSTYDWQKGIGPIASRGVGVDFSGNPQKMVVGTDEYLDLLSRTGRPGLITANVAGTADSAAAWAEYILSAAPGRVSCWEIGNESYLNQDPSFMSSTEYVKRFNAFATAIKEVDPSAQVGAILEGSLVGVIWAKVVVPEAESWNEVVVKGTADLADFYTVHMYAPFDQHEDETATLKVIQTAPLAMAKNLKAVTELVSEYDSGASIRVTEFNVGMSDSLAAWKFDISLAQASYVAQMLAQFSLNGVTGANHWSLIGNHCFGQIKEGDDPRLRPSALLYGLLASLGGSQAVETTVDADKMDYMEIGNVVSGLSPDIAFVQAYKKGDVTMVLAVNRKPDSSAEVVFQKSDGSAWTMAGGKMLTGKTPLAQIDSTPDGVRVVNLEGGATLTLPACSVALVELQ